MLCSDMAGEGWLFVMREGQLASWLSFSQQTMMAMLNHRSKHMHDAGWMSNWNARSKTCEAAELAHMLELCVTLGKGLHVQALLLAMGQQHNTTVLLCPLKHYPSYLFLAVHEAGDMLDFDERDLCGHVDTVRALLEVGGLELLMITKDNGWSCLHAAVYAKKLCIVQELLHAGGWELLALTSSNIRFATPTHISCLYLAAEEGDVDIVQMLLLEAGERGRELIMLGSEHASQCSSECSSIDAAVSSGSALTVEALRLCLRSV